MQPGEVGAKNHKWLGDKVGYNGLHDWIIRHYGNANKCEDPLCAKVTKFYEWANISGKYRRDRADFKMLCRSCHRILDKRKPFCANGHEFTPENTRIGKVGRRRFCRTCDRNNYHRYRSRTRLTTIIERELK